MAVNWKRPEGPFVTALQKFFFEQGSMTNLDIRRSNDHPNPATSFVCAPETEVAEEIGIDVGSLDDVQASCGPLVHVTDLDFEDQAEQLSPVIPPDVRYEFFIAAVEGKGRYVFCTDAVLSYEP